MSMTKRNFSEIALGHRHDVVLTHVCILRNKMQFIYGFFFYDSISANTKCTVMPKWFLQNGLIIINELSGNDNIVLTLVSLSHDCFAFLLCYCFHPRNRYCFQYVSKCQKTCEPWCDNERSQVVSRPRYRRGNPLFVWKRAFEFPF